MKADENSYYTSPRITSEIPDCAMCLTFDHYSYCSLGCIYCFAYFFKSNNPSLKGGMGLKVVDVDKMIRIMKGDAKSKYDKFLYECFYKKKFVLHWGGLADPFCNFEKANKAGLKLMNALGEMNYPTLFSFKGGSIFNKEYVELFEKYKKQKNFSFQVSMITADHSLAREIEIGVPSPRKRIEAMKMLKDMGYWVVLRLRPYIIGITDLHIDQLLEQSLEAGIDGISMEFLAMDCRSNTGMKTRYNWLAKKIGVEGGAKGLHEYFKALSPKSRGGYMRLNRLVKEPHVKKVFKFCLDNNLVFACSDPDYKELNMSGSCCGLPEKHKGNPGLDNWTTSQLTYYLKEARRIYHTAGKIMEFKFDEVYPDNDYLMDKIAAPDHVGVIGMSNADRANSNLKTILQLQWNNLNSPANPRNYFHGKLMPLNRLDEKGNYIYIYKPLEYEKRWADEGIEMTR